MIQAIPMGYEIRVENGPCFASMAIQANQRRNDLSNATKTPRV